MAVAVPVEQYRTEYSFHAPVNYEKNYVNIWRYGLRVLITTLTYALHRRGMRRSRNWSRILSA